MTKQELTDMVLVRMNEFPESGIAFVGSDRVKAETLVKSILTEAYRTIARIVPKEWLPVNQLPTSSSYLIQDPVHGTGYIILPDNYLFLHTLRFKTWHNSLHNTISDTSDEAKMQHNLYVRGNVVRPVGVIAKKTISGNTKQVLHYYSLREGTNMHIVEEALYIPLVNITAMTDNEDTGLDIRLYPALSYMAASLAYGILEKADAAKYCESRVQQFIN